MELPRPSGSTASMSHARIHIRSTALEDDPPENTSDRIHRQIIGWFVAEMLLDRLRNCRISATLDLHCIVYSEIVSTW